jgi:hypothetical protein
LDTAALDTAALGAAFAAGLAGFATGFGPVFTALTGADLAVERAGFAAVFAAGARLAATLPRAGAETRLVRADGVREDDLAMASRRSTLRRRLARYTTFVRLRARRDTPGLRCKCIANSYDV